MPVQKNKAEQRFSDKVIASQRCRLYVKCWYPKKLKETVSRHKLEHLDQLEMAKT